MKITHSVFFTLQHRLESTEARHFIDYSVKVLSTIPSVENFQALRQTSLKNPYHYGFSMQFANQEAYDTYNAHPVHISYVEQIWKLQVVDFMEIDYVQL